MSLTSASGRKRTKIHWIKAHLVDETVARLVNEMGLDPVDFGPLRMARSIEALAIIYMIPLLQRRSEEWEFYFRRNADWVCQWQDDWSDPVYDSDRLAKMPETQDPPKPCP